MASGAAAAEKTAGPHCGEERGKMKKCSNCGYLYPDEGSFCPACGNASATVFLRADQQQPPAYQPMDATVPYTPPAAQPQPGQQPQVGYQSQQAGQPQMGYQPRQAGQPQMGYQPQEAGQPPATAPAAAKPKKGKSGLVATLLVFFVVFIIGLISTLPGKKKESPSLTLPEVTFDVPAVTTAPAADFTTGEVRNGYYVNEWANLKLKVDGRYTQADPSEYADAESPLFKVGYWGEGDHTALQISFIMNYALSFNSDDEKAIFEEFSKSYFSSDGYDNFELQLPEYFFVNGQAYYGARNKMADTDYEVVLMIRVIDKHVCCISVMGTAAQNDALIASFTGCN